MVNTSEMRICTVTVRDSSAEEDSSAVCMRKLPIQPTLKASLAKMGPKSNKSASTPLRRMYACHYRLTGLVMTWNFAL